MIPSSFIILYIKGKESLSLKAFKDDDASTPAKVEYSIGFGHQIQKGEEYLMNGIDIKTAELLLSQDVGRVGNFVNSIVKVPLTQGAYDAIVDFVYNVGTGNFEGSTLLKKINAKAPFVEIAAEFRKWRKGGGVILPGLIGRREDEIAIWMGSYKKKALL